MSSATNVNFSAEQLASYYAFTDGGTGIVQLRREQYTTNVIYPSQGGNVNVERNAEITSVSTAKRRRPIRRPEMNSVIEYASSLSSDSCSDSEVNIDDVDSCVDMDDEVEVVEENDSIVVDDEPAVEVVEECINIEDEASETPIDVDNDYIDVCGIEGDENGGKSASCAICGGQNAEAVLARNLIIILPPYLRKFAQKKDISVCEICMGKLRKIEKMRLELENEEKEVVQTFASTVRADLDETIDVESMELQPDSICSLCRGNLLSLSKTKRRL